VNVTVGTTVGATAVAGISELVTNDPAHGGVLGIVRDAALVVADGRIVWVGPAARLPAVDRFIDVGGRAVLPGFVDSHTHLVFAGDRGAEFEARMSGVPYDGGGIATTVSATRQAPDDALRALLSRRVRDAAAQGTTTLEVKSGYGLDVAGETRALRLGGEVTSETTFLGAHVVPPGSTREDFVRLVCGEMLRACAPLARWIDVFCEPLSPHAFDADEAREVLTAGASAGLGLRVHANQLGAGPGVRLAVELGAASADHCSYLTDDDVDALADASGALPASAGPGSTARGSAVPGSPGRGSAVLAAGAGTVATLLPAAEFATRAPYPDARRLLDAGVTVALATDCNPGTAYTVSMPFVIALAVRELGMTPAEAVWSATAGGARALRRGDIGVVAVGARADLAVLDAPTHVHLAYRPGMPIAHRLDLPNDATLIDPTLSDPTLSDPPLTDPTLIDPTLSDPPLTDPTMKEPHR